MPFFGGEGIAFALLLTAPHSNSSLLFMEPILHAEINLITDKSITRRNVTLNSAANIALSDVLLCLMF
jgi:hypothetical protein